jgi:hypothetical protein
MNAIRPCESVAAGAICATVSMFLPQCSQRIAYCIKGNVGYSTLFQGLDDCERIGTGGERPASPGQKSADAPLRKINA